MLRDPAIQLDDLEQFKLGLRDLPEEEQSVRQHGFVDRSFAAGFSLHAFCTDLTPECAGGSLYTAAHRNA